MDRRRFMDLAEDIIQEWRDILYLDPIWRIYIETFENEELAFGRLDTSGAAYFMATIEIAESAFGLSEEKFVKNMNNMISHELVHLAAIDFYRTALLSVGDDEKLKNELIYRYEQFTTRLQRAFIDLKEECNVSEESSERGLCPSS